MRRKLLNFYMEVRMFRKLKDDEKFYETPPWSWTTHDNPVKDYDAFMACYYLHDSKNPDAQSEMAATVLVARDINCLGKYSLSSPWSSPLMIHEGGAMVDMRDLIMTSVAAKTGWLEVDA